MNLSLLCSARPAANKERDFIFKTTKPRNKRGKKSDSPSRRRRLASPHCKGVLQRSELETFIVTRKGRRRGGARGEEDGAEVEFATSFAPSLSFIHSSFLLAVCAGAWGAPHAQHRAAFKRLDRSPPPPPPLDLFPT